MKQQNYLKTTSLNVYMRLFKYIMLVWVHFNPSIKKPFIECSNFIAAQVLA
jgi:hypothetical protein